MRIMSALMMTTPIVENQMARSVYQTDEDVIVILRHDPGSSDIVDVGSVLSVDFFDTPSTSYTDEQKLELAENWAIDREIEFIKADVDEPPSTESEQEYHEAMVFAESLTRDNFTKQTTLWFEAVLMPLILRQV